MLRIGFVVEDLDRSGAPWNYIFGLIEHMSRRDDVAVGVIYCRGDSSRLPDTVTRIKRPVRPYPTLLLPDRPQMPKLHRIEKEHDFDLFHLNEIPDFGHWGVMRSDTPVVTTVHGTAYWERLPVKTHPRNYQLRRRWFDRLGQFTLTRALTVSDYVTETLITRAGYSPDRVTTTYEAIDDVFFTQEQSQPEHTPDEYILHVSNQSPKKNLETVLRSYRRLRAQYNVDLVVAGSGWESTCSGLVSDLGISERVHFEGYVPQERLVSLYDGADCFVYPSYHETFGLPNVEAMARGVPVVTSSCHAIPEIVGDAAVTVDNPGDAVAVRTAIEHVLDNQSLRRNLIERGRNRSADFRWDRHVQTVVETYESILH